ncbi:MAG: hemolysin family protein [Cyanobacteria bacterium J06638_20]
MSSVSFEILIILILILANGLFAMSEMSIVSARKIRLADQAEKGDRRAQAALNLANSPNRFLATIQVGITVIGILAGAFGGATLAGSVAELLSAVPMLAPYSQPLGFALVVILTAYLSLIVGELVPKRLALNNPEAIAIRVARSMNWLSAIAYPIVHLLSFSTDAVMGLLGIPSTTDQEQFVTEDEIKVMVRQGAEAGMFEAAEQDMVERVFHLADHYIAALMTPRMDIVWLDVNDPEAVNHQKLIDTGHGRYPVCQGHLDNVLGVAYVTDLFPCALKSQPMELVHNFRKPLFVPERTTALKVLELFKQSGTHIALVVDEYGVIQGIVTLNDVMEVVMGDIPFADHDYESPIVQREDGSWLLDGMVTVDKLKEVFDLGTLPEEERGNYQTLGGFVISQLGRIPAAADYFEWAGWRFEVMDMDGNRVDKILIMAVEPPSNSNFPTTYER